MTTHQPSSVTALRPPVFVEPGTDLQAAAIRMAEAGTSSILVGAPGELVSILTERDIARAVARGDEGRTPVEQLAVPAPITIDAQATATEAAGLMLEANVRHLVVTRGQRAVGVVSMREVLGAVLLPTQAQVLVAVVGQAGAPHPEHWWG